MPKIARRGPAGLAGGDAVPGLAEIAGGPVSLRVYPHASGADIGVRTGLIPIDRGRRRRQS
jgi:hypothetical protein